MIDLTPIWAYLTIFYDGFARTRFFNSCPDPRTRRFLSQIR